jgi:hypothetical protein
MDYGYNATPEGNDRHHQHGSSLGQDPGDQRAARACDSSCVQQGWGANGMAGAYVQYGNGTPSGYMMPIPQAQTQQQQMQWQQTPMHSMQPSAPVPLFRMHNPMDWRAQCSPVQMQPFTPNAMYPMPPPGPLFPQAQPHQMSGMGPAMSQGMECTSRSRQ